MNALRKILLAIYMLTFGVCFAVAQTNTTKHTVERGETLTSIAKQYATTEAKIIELNPNAAHFLYIGMELIIPNAQERKQSEELIPHAHSSNTVVPPHS